MAIKDTPLNIAEINREELAQILLEQIQDNLIQMGYDDEQIDYAMDPLIGEHPSVIEYYLNEGETLIARAEEFVIPTESEEDVNELSENEQTAEQLAEDELNENQISDGEPSQNQTNEGEQTEVLPNNAAQNEETANETFIETFNQVPHFYDNNIIYPPVPVTNNAIDPSEEAANNILWNNLNPDKQESETSSNKRPHEDTEDNNKEDIENGAAASKYQKTM